jgi:hypothetical protein
VSAPELAPTAAAADGRRLPPVAELATLSLALVVVGGVFIAAHAPRKAPLEFPIVLAALSGALVVWNVVTLARLRRFARAKFLLVFKWALLAYTISAGMLEYVFIYDDVPGTTLALLTVMLVLFAWNVPTIIAYTVARHERVELSD